MININFGRVGGTSGQHGQGSEASTASKKSTLSNRIYPEKYANAVLPLLSVACTSLDRQVARLAVGFETEGGFAEGLYHVRQARRRSRW